ncbi:FRG domain-containing protein [Rhizobium leguminosarum]|uniref:FRG domain-containing protein n=1 Tax=Rhizobium ruizarguesonis TaxID=2081791 RepID=UPI0013BD0767|nr:FRG domain-containing protein [Rhizobium ruizarguesonis]NEJ08543.1 FRG domain-containing protein [Rhizobium ruizarguesonis]
MTISHFSDFIRAVEKFRGQARKPNELWYRGHGAETYKLEPFIHRGRVSTDRADIELKEQAVYDEFVRRSPLYDVHKRDQWDLLFLMQHYRAPTRLLDWTASPLVALFFALMAEDKKEHSVIWCLDPGEWNATILADINEPARIFTTDEGLVKQYHPTFSEKSNRTEPLAIQGIMNNPRINAQKGRFVIFGSEPKPLEEYAKQYKLKPGGPILSRLLIDKDAKSVILKDLESYGITYSTIFPDLEGLAIEIRRHHGGPHV